MLDIRHTPPDGVILCWLPAPLSAEQTLLRVPGAICARNTRWREHGKQVLEGNPDQLPSVPIVPVCVGVLQGGGGHPSRLLPTLHADGGPHVPARRRCQRRCAVQCAEGALGGGGMCWWCDSDQHGVCVWKVW